MIDHVIIMVRRSPQSYLCGKAIIVAAINSKGLQLDFSSNLEFIMEMEVEAGAVVDKGADGGGGGDGADHPEPTRES